MIRLRQAQNSAEPEEVIILPYQYKYVRMRTGGGFWINNEECAHREIIDELAAEGWRYVGYIPTMFSSEGGTKEVDLIFETGTTPQN